MEFFDNFSRAFSFQILNFSENENNSNVLKTTDQWRKWLPLFGVLTEYVSSCPFNSIQMLIKLPSDVQKIASFKVEDPISQNHLLQTGLLTFGLFISLTKTEPIYQICNPTSHWDFLSVHDSREKREDIIFPLCYKTQHLVFKMMFTNFKASCN